MYFFVFLCLLCVYSSLFLSFYFFSLPGDPLDVPGLTNSLYTQQQLAHYDEAKRLLYMKIALEKQHRIATLSFCSTISKRLMQ